MAMKNRLPPLISKWATIVSIDNIQPFLPWMPRPMLSVLARKTIEGCSYLESTAWTSRLPYTAA